MLDRYNLSELKQNALNDDIEAFRQLLFAFKELYHLHDDEHEELGSFLLQHVTQLILVIVEELTNWFSIDDNFNCYDYLFSSFSDESIRILEKEFFSKFEENDFEILNYEILVHLFERGVSNDVGWNNTINLTIKRVEERLDSILMNKQISLTEFSLYYKISMMWFDYYLKQEELSNEDQFVKWAKSSNQYENQLKKAFEIYIAALKKLKTD
ncbi:hypothetical protein [Paenibacillus rhizoplanae]|uniref:Uncharacterized protein n=3 Tax=Paenibacillus rhizoplanae TaxID=1917181 RepID=A0ABW5FA21_9BACL